MEEIEFLYATGVESAPEIYRRLQASERTGRIPQGETPSARTVRRIVDELRVADESEPWTLADAGDEAAAFVMDVQAALFEGGVLMAWGEPGVHLNQLTREHVRWLGKIYSVRPDMPPLLAGLVVRHLLVREARREPFDDLEGLLAFAPWRGDEESARYWAQLLTGKLRPVPQYLFTADWIPQVGPIRIVPLIVTKIVQGWMRVQQGDSDWERDLEEHGWDESSFEDNAIQLLQEEIYARLRDATWSELAASPPDVWAHLYDRLTGPTVEKVEKREDHGGEAR